MRKVEMRNKAGASVWEWVPGSGVWVFLCGLLMQYAVWFFPVQRAAAGRGDTDFVGFFLLCAVPTTVVGVMAAWAMKDPERRLTGWGLCGWVVTVGGVVGMLGVLGPLWWLYEQGRMDWDWGYWLMCRAGVFGAAGMGVCWWAVRRIPVWVMGVGTAAVSMGAMATMGWWMKPYFFGAEAMFRQMEASVGVFAVKVLVGGLLAITAVMMVVRKVSGERHKRALAEGWAVPARVAHELETVPQVMRWLLWVPGCALWIFPIPAGLVVGPAGVFVALLGILALHLGLGMWLLWWAFANRTAVMPRELHHVLLWRYQWAALILSLCGAGAGMSLWALVCEGVGWRGLVEVIPLIGFLGFVASLVVVFKAWRRLSGLAVFEYLWAMGFAEMVFAPICIWVVSEDAWRWGAIEWGLMGVLMAAGLLPSAVLLVMRAGIEHQRPVMKKEVEDHCLACGYDLTGTLAAGRVECPECGQAV